MQDLRRIAERRASRPKSKPVGSSFETEHQRAKKAVVKQIEELSGSDIHMIAATTEDESGQKKILRVTSYCRVSTDDVDQAVSIALQIKEYKEKIGRADGYRCAAVSSRSSPGAPLRGAFFVRKRLIILTIVDVRMPVC